MITKKIYFLSDLHLGAKAISSPHDHERRVVRFLDSIKHEAKAIYLLGDIIDFWFEYKTVVPRGFTRFFGKLGELSDMGIEIHWFTGNHDIWLFDYLPQELGVKVHNHALVMQIDGKKFYLAHGDGLGDDSAAYKLMKGFFRNKFCQKLFSMIHPGITVSFAHNWSKHSRETGGHIGFSGEDNEKLVQFAKKTLETSHIDYFIFGHRHIMLDIMLKGNSRVIILGDWISLFSYAVYDGKDIWLEQFEQDDATPESPGMSIAF